MQLKIFGQAAKLQADSLDWERFVDRSDMFSNPLVVLW